MNLLNKTSDSKIVTRKSNNNNDQSNANYDVENEINYNAKVLKSNLSDYHDSYILVKGNIARAGNTVAQAFINWAPFFKCITKIDGTTKNDSKHLDLVMSMWSLDETLVVSLTVTHHQN